MRLEAVQVTPELEIYMEGLLPSREPVLARVESEVEREGIPAIGAAVGRLLYLLLKMSRALDVLELGTATGYSAIWLARGCSGRVVTLETDPDRAERARRNIEEAGLSGRVEVLTWDAMAYLERPGGQFDCVFNDLLNTLPGEDVVERCFELSLQRIRPGGLLIADNALRRGEVVRADGRQARNVVRYNELVAQSERLEAVIVPLRDGVSIARVREG